MTFPPDLLEFVNRETWTFAKTYAPRWPHEYLVRERVDQALFERLVRHIRQHGYEGRFYRMKITYFDEAGLTYWTMGEPLADTTIINRCPKESTYEERLKRDTLPK